MVKLLFVAISMFLLLNVSKVSNAFSFNNNKNDEESTRLQESSSLMSRRDLLTWPVGIGGAFVYGKLVTDSIEKLSRGDLVYPKDHERRVQDTISKSLTASVIPLDDDNMRPLRVLEVGLGKEWRVARRGLYQDALKDLSSMDAVKEVELTGMDISVPSDKIVQDAERRMENISKDTLLNVNMKVVTGSITSKLDFPDGWFDAVICSLTLCSVDDQQAALNEICRLVRPNGGTFGYVEHVAVDEDEPYKLLELQQRLFDPLQQAVADNCHLHRYTDVNIGQRFHIQDPQQSSRIYHERFFVNGMWPVSCQCCGIIQRRA
jgi:SAM-dependent methyltransferase